MKRNVLKNRLMGYPILLYLFPFLIIMMSFVLHVCIKGAHEASGYYLIHYLYTYKHGFIPRGLVGEVLSWFFEKITDQITRDVIILFSVLLIISSSLCIGKALSKSIKNEERFKIVLGIIILICIVPISFRAYFEDMKLDKVLWALSLFAIYLMDTKVGVFLTPFVCVIATLINPVFLFCSMLMVSIAMLYNCVESNFSKKWLILCALSYASMIAIGIYGSISEKHLGFKTAEELIKYYFLRYDGELPKTTLDFMAKECMIDYFLPLKEFVKAAFDYYFIEWQNGYSMIFNLIFVSIPIYCGLTAFWIHTLKTEVNKNKKIIYILCAISPIVQIAPIIMSWETSKYLGNNILVQLCLIVFFIVKGNNTIIDTALYYIKKLSQNKLEATAIITYLGLYIFASV